MGFYDDWQKAKKKFEADTGKKKPSKKFLGVFRLSAGLDNAAKSCDKAAVYDRKVGVTKGNSAAMSKAAKDFKKHADNYLGVVDKAIGEEDKELQPHYHRSLKLLRTSLEAISAAVQLQVDAFDARVKNLSTLEYAAKIFNSGLKRAMASALKAIQEVKKDPTASTYNDQFPKAARDITQQIGNLNKLRTKFPTDTFPQYNLPAGDPTPLFNALVPWADHGRVKVANDATEQVVLREIKDFSTQVKAVARFCGM